MQPSVFRIKRSCSKQLRPEAFVSSSTDLTGDEVQCPAGGVRSLDLARSHFFAHEGIWLFLSYLNVLPKCLPAIVAKSLSFTEHGAKRTTNAFSIHLVTMLATRAPC